MLDDQKQKLILGSLLVASLGMGSWYFVFSDGHNGREDIAIKNSGDKPNRHEAIAASTPTQTRIRPRAGQEPERENRQERKYQPKKPIRRGVRDYDNRRRIKREKFTTPMAVAPFDESNRVA